MKKMSMMKKIIFMVLMCVCMLTACHENTGTRFEFSFQTKGKENSDTDERTICKTIYINESQDKVRLNASLDMDGGEVSVQITAVEDGTIIWESVYEQSCDFTVDLQNVKAGSEYVIKVQAKDPKKVKLVMSSKDILVKEKEKPQQTSHAMVNPNME